MTLATANGVKYSALAGLILGTVNELSSPNMGVSIIALGLGLAFGVDYQIENFHVGVSYDLGLKDINAFAKDMNDEAGYTPIKNRTALFTLGFDF